MDQVKMQLNSKQTDQFAELVSNIFHPLLVVIPTLVIAMTRLGSSVWQAIFWTTLAIAIVNLPMALLLFWGVRSGKYSDASVSIREQRNSIYAVGGICLVILLAVLVIAKAPVVLIACLVSAVIATALGYWINRYTKLSLHSAAMAGCTAVLLLTAPQVGLVMAVFTPVVGWARIRLKHHTPAQILIGWILPMTCVFLVFRLML
jgi:membrane-associated phospholipid phosphatase